MMARAQGFPRNLLPILVGMLAMLVGGGLLYTAFHGKQVSSEDKAPQAAVQPGRPENVLARANKQVASAAAELPATPGGMVSISGQAPSAAMPSGPLPDRMPEGDFRMPAGTPPAPSAASPARSSTSSPNGVASVDAYAQRKEAARTATASLAAYEEFDTATTRQSTAAATTASTPDMDALAAADKALAGMAKPAAAGNDSTATLVQRALQAAQGGGTSTAAKKLDTWSKDQRAVGDTEPPLTATEAASQWMLFQGTAIPAVLVTPVTSSAPGSITARVTRDVFDDVRAQGLLIPKGSRLYGTYMNEVGAGQNRILMAFSRLIYPDGRSVRLSGFGGGDPMGRSGVPADVNNHFWEMFGRGFLIAGIAKVFDRSSQTNVTVINQGGGATTLTDSAGQILSDTARKVLERNQNISPTLSLSGGYQFNVIVNRDMALAPYTSL